MREFFKNLPDKSTPLNAQRMNGFLNGDEAMGSIVVDDISCKNKLNLSSRTIGVKTNGTSTADNFEDLSSNEEIKIKPLVVATFFSHQVVINNLKPNTDYTLSSTFNGTWQVYVYSDKLYGNVVFSQPLRNSNTFNTGDNTSLILSFYSYNNPINATYSISNILLEEGSTPTEYTPYKSLGYTSGSNENGSWVKYDDGRMECVRSVRLSIDCTTVWGSLFEGASGEIGTFPQSFIETPEVFVTPKVADAFIESMRDTTQTNWGKIRIALPVSRTSDFQFSLLAKGRWK